MEVTPTAELDRSQDRVYDCTTSVVRSVMGLSRGVQAGHAQRYLDLVKTVGYELRELLAAVDKEVASFPSAAHREVRRRTCCERGAGGGLAVLGICFRLLVDGNRYHRV